MKNTLILLICVMAVIFMAACAPVEAPINPQQQGDTQQAEPAIILPSKVEIYAADYSFEDLLKTPVGKAAAQFPDQVVFDMKPIPVLPFDESKEKARYIANTLTPASSSRHAVTQKNEGFHSFQGKDTQAFLEA